MWWFNDVFTHLYGGQHVFFSPSLWVSNIGWVGRQTQRPPRAAKALTTLVIHYTRLHYRDNPPGTVEDGGRRRERQRQFWNDNIKEWRECSISSTIVCFDDKIVVLHCDADASSWNPDNPRTKLQDKRETDTEGQRDSGRERERNYIIIMGQVFYRISLSSRVSRYILDPSPTLLPHSCLLPGCY